MKEPKVPGKRWALLNCKEDIMHSFVHLEQQSSGIGLPMGIKLGAVVDHG